MTENRILEELASFIRTLVADEKLEKAGGEGASALVPPVVVVGYLPPKNYLPEGYDIPSIVVGVETGEDNGEEAGITVKLTFATYSAGETNEQGELIPDMKGYVDLLHIMTKVRIALLQTIVINGVTTIEPPIKWGMYQEQPWPYWYGYMTFNARCATQRMQDQVTEFLMEEPANIQIPAEGNF